MSGVESQQEQLPPSEDEERLEAELEFVQCLANAKYLQCEPPPAQNVYAPVAAWGRLHHPPSVSYLMGFRSRRRLALIPDLAFHYLEDKSFLKYLAYLQYWRRPEYSK